MQRLEALFIALEMCRARVTLFEEACTLGIKLMSPTYLVSVDFGLLSRSLKGLPCRHGAEGTSHVSVDDAQAEDVTGIDPPETSLKLAVS